MKKVVGFIVCLTFLWGGYSATASQQLIEQMEKVSDERQIAESELEAIDQKLNQTIEELQRVQKEIAVQQSLIDYYGDLLEQKLSDLGEEKEMVFTRIRVLQQVDSLSVIEFMIETENYFELISRFAQFGTMLQQDFQRFEDYHDDLNEFKEKQEGMKEAREKLEKQKLSVESLKQDYEKQKQEKSLVLEQFKREEGELLELLNEQILTMGDLMNQMKQDQSQSSEIGVPVFTFSGVWPLEKAGRITSLFGRRIDPFTKEVKSHSGTDIAAEEGTKILAISEGIVKFTGYMRGYGNVVIIDHGKGWRSLYAHIRPGGILVQTNQEVQPGSKIAEVGTTGRSTGPHLHVELFLKGTRTDPLVHLQSFMNSNQYSNTQER